MSMEIKESVFYLISLLTQPATINICIQSQLCFEIGLLFCEPEL